MSKMKKVLPFIAVTMMGADLFAVSDMQVRNLENRVNALEQRRGANGMINPPARPVVKDGINLWLQAEALAMHATEDGLQFAIKQPNPSSFTAPELVNGRVKNVSYNWNWGWRVGVGYNLPHDGWDMLLNFTWFRAGEDTETNRNATDGVSQTWTHPAYAGNFINSTASIPRATGFVTLKFRYLDFQMGREFFVSKWLTLRPYVGARGLWNHRNLRVHYTIPNVVSLHAKMNTWCRAGGLLTGLDSQWSVGMGWSVYGQCAVSLLYGRQWLRTEQEQFLASGGEKPVVHLSDRWNSVRFMADLGAGIRWDQPFCDDAYRIRLQLGWEEHILTAFDRDIIFPDDIMHNDITFNHGDLAISGLAFQARFDF